MELLLYPARVSVLDLVCAAEEEGVRAGWEAARRRGGDACYVPRDSFNFAARRVDSLAG